MHLTGYRESSHRVGWKWVWLTVTLGLHYASLALAQLPSADLQTVYPPFAKAGSTVNVVISGKSLEAIETLLFNDPRFSVAPEHLPANPPIYPEPRPVKNRFLVTIPADLGPGIYEVRARGYLGLSTARPFQVLPALANHRVEESVHDSPDKGLPVNPGESIYGTIGARNVEWFKLEAKKGLRYFMTVWGERLDSKIDPEIRVFDDRNRELERSRDYFGRDPFLDFTAPSDGVFSIAVADNLYRGGGNDYFYRFEVHQDPHIDLIWPPAGLPGTKQKFTVIGRNLPGGTPAGDFEIDGKPVEKLLVEIDVPPTPSVPTTFSSDTPRRALNPGFEYRIGPSNAVRIGFATAPIVEETSTSNVPMKVSVPVEIAGRFDHPGDSDAYRFTAEKDKSYWIEVYCDRLGVSADPVLIVQKVDGEGKKTVIAEVDDFPNRFRVDNADGTNLNSRDASYHFVPKETGEFEVLLLNQSASGSPAHVYRLAIREAKPDFQLVCATEDLLTATNGRAAYAQAPLLRKNDGMVYRVAAFRQDGFDGDITITAEGLPPGVTAGPLVLRGDTDEGFLAIHANSDVRPWSGGVRLIGKADLAEQKAERIARNATLVWGENFADNVRVRTRLDIETPLSVIDHESAPCRIAASANTFSVEFQQSLEIPVIVTDIENLRKGNLTVQPLGLRGMLRSEPSVTIAEGQSQGILKINFKPDGNFKATPGTFDFVLNATGLARHRSQVSAVAEAELEVARLKKLKEDFSGKVAQLKTAPPDPANPALRKELDDAEKVLRDVDGAITNAEKMRSDAENTAKEKDTKFVTRSEIITVTVTTPKIDPK